MRGNRKPLKRVGETKIYKIMGLRICKRCGKQYDPSLGRSAHGSYCSTRCFELDLKQKREEAMRKAIKR